ncbi:Coenzyme Q-binding protein COQ10, START domain [Dillenia turbinata]|uniref:Coenzyme Q-binding protein COQ10, START domain n=1 Tax=Dillenia turbinata TaxID=194707 RepID=A0AAN8VXM7_9MAGN
MPPPPFVSASKAIGRLISRRNGCGNLMRKYAPIQCLSGIAAGVDNNKLIGDHKNCGFSLGSNNSIAVQKRGFLGCGDGEESLLSKVYEERRVLGYSPEQLFAVVAAVDLYQQFVPWCTHSEILQRHPDGSFDAELEIGFKFLVESYNSHVVLDKPRSIKTTATESTLFEHLINIWEFNPGPVPGTCDVYFLVDFKFQSPLYRQVASLFFKEVVSRLVSSFTNRCHLIYGPGVQVLENRYQQRV